MFFFRGNTLSTPWSFFKWEIVAPSMKPRSKITVFITPLPAAATKPSTRSRNLGISASLPAITSTPAKG